MLDSDRKKRLHVVGCRMKNNTYVLVVEDTDKSQFEIGWNTWISLGGVSKRWWKNV